MLYEIIKIVIYIFAFLLGWKIWSTVVDNFDEFLKRKLTDRQYDVVTNIIFVMCIIFVLCYIFL